MVWRRWSSDDGPALAGLRRVISLLMALEIALVAITVVVDSAAAERWPALGLWTLVTVLLLVAARCLVSGFGVTELAAYVVVLSALIVVDTGGEAWHFSTALVQTNVVIGCCVALRARPAILVGLTAVAASVALAFAVGREALSYHALDLGVLQSGTLIAGALLIEALWRNARRYDALALENAALREREVAQQVTRSAEEVVRRVIHDDVLSALRSVAEARAGDTEYVRVACAEAVAQIARLRASRG